MVKSEEKKADKKNCVKNSDEDDIAEKPEEKEVRSTVRRGRRQLRMRNLPGRLPRTLVTGDDEWRRKMTGKQLQRTGDTK